MCIYIQTDDQLYYERWEKFFNSYPRENNTRSEMINNGCSSMTEMRELSAGAGEKMRESVIITNVNEGNKELWRHH